MMRPSSILRSLLILFLLVPAGVHAQKKPNIIVILADDMGIDSVSANNDQIGEMKTPRIDQLIAEGMNFTDAHSGSAVCTPTRYGLLTGRYCWRTKLKKSVLWDYAAPLIEDERITVAEMLRDQGYTTGMVGKWHLGMDWRNADGEIINHTLKLSDSSYQKSESGERVRAVEAAIDFTQPISGGPTDHGFDYYWGVDVPNFPPYIWIENEQVLGIPTERKPKEMFGHPGLMRSGWKLEAILPTLAQKAGDWITEQSKTEDPFFLYLPLTSPHTPIAPSEPFQGKSNITPYADFIIETDWVVGHVLDTLEAAGIADDTLVLFTADNGTANPAKFDELKKHGVDLQAHFKGKKAQIHEGGHRVPMAIRWPGKVEAGSVCDELVCLNDFMATAAELIGTKLPEGSAEDSTSILSLITGEATTLPDRPMVINHDYPGNFAIRKGPWKLVEQGNGGQLFNLADDPKETTNLAKANPELVKELLDSLNEIRDRGAE